MLTNLRKIVAKVMIFVMCIICVNVNSTYVAKASETTNVPVKSLTLAASTVSVPKGDGVQIIPTVTPSNADNKALVYTSSNEDIATVDENGNITGISKGTAMITVSSTDGSNISSSITVNVTAITIVIDPGHGGTQTGTFNGTEYEKNYNLDMAVACKSELEKYSGVQVYLTREDDATVALQDRAIAAQNMDADILISFHQNASVNHNAYGSEIFISQSQYKDEYNKNSTLLADSILAQLSLLGFTNRGVKTRSAVDDIYSFDNTKADYYGIIRYSVERGFPGIIIEHGFMDYESDFALMDTYEERENIGKNDAIGIAKYYCLSEKGEIKKLSILVNNVSLDATSKTLYKGKTCTLTTTVIPENAADRSVIWSSDDTNVATVSQTGIVTAKGKGSCTITAKAKDGSGAKATCVITVKILTSKIALNATNKTLYKGKTFAIKSKVTPTNANNRAVTYSSNNTKVATVSQTGVVTAKGKGSCTITVKAKDGSNVKATCIITVRIYVSKIALSATSKTINKGKTYTLKSKVTPTNANNKAVTYSSNNTSIATVNSKGKIIAKKKGTCTITVKAKDGSGKKATCKVTVK